MMQRYKQCGLLLYSSLYLGCFVVMFYLRGICCCLCLCLPFARRQGQWCACFYIYIRANCV